MMFLYEFIGTGIIKKELEDKLEEIAMILAHEIDDNLNLWGAEDEAGELFIAVREDLQTPEWEKRMNELYDKYSIKG